ncbi:MAG TPA: VWA domain-containing protein, partial [Polyangiaceae bacterium]
MKRGLVTVLDEALWALRREGFTISTAQAIDAVHAIASVGLDDEAHFRDALAAVVLDRARDRARFDAILDAFFHPLDRGAWLGGTLWERLGARGFTELELDAVRDLLGQLAAATPDGASETATFEALLGHGADLDRLLSLSGLARRIDADSGLQLGFQTHRLLGQLGTARARQTLGQLRALLRDSLGAERGDALAEALAKELEQAEDHVRAHVRRTYESRVAEADRQRAGRMPSTTPFASLSDAEIEEVRRGVRRFAERLRGGARVRARRARKGRIDPHRPLRRALRTGGVPFSPARRRPRRDRPKLVLLCDVSDSVRAAAAFLLEFTYAAQELFSKTRSFVFVSDLGETTDLFAREPVRVAIAQAWGGGVVRS